MKKVLTLSTVLVVGFLLIVSPANSEITRRLTLRQRGASPQRGTMGKLGAALARLHTDYADSEARGTQATFKPFSRLIRAKAGLVLIDAVAADDAATLHANLKALGLQRSARFGRLVSGWFPITAIDKMGSLQSLQYARLSVARTQAGVVTSQGDEAMRSDIARVSSGVDGTGVTVGVLSDSYNCLGDAADDIANGDLPSKVTVRDDLNGIECLATGTDEGRAMYPKFPAFCRWRERMEALPTTIKLRAALPPREPIQHAREWSSSHRPKY